MLRVFKRMTYKDDSHSERIRIFIMVVDQYHRYSNEAKRADIDIYADFKLKKIPLVSMIYATLL